MPRHLKMKTRNCFYNLKLFENNIIAISTRLKRYFYFFSGPLSLENIANVRLVHGLNIGYIVNQIAKFCQMSNTHVMCVNSIVVVPVMTQVSMRLVVRVVARQ